MPVTVNGIGARYYGHRNCHATSGVCEFCRRPAVLSNYDTTLFFTVFYLPILPLGKKQIFSECSVCRKHRVMPLARWQQVRAQTVDAARAASEAAPLDPAAAVNLLQTQYACFQRDDAAHTARELHDRFPENAEVQLVVAECLDLCGAKAEAERAYLTVLQLQPGNQAAKRALAMFLIGRGELDTALRLINASPALEASRDPVLFSQLGKALAEVGRHAEALPALTGALAAAPALGHQPEFRRALAAVEEANGVEASALPRQSIWRRRPGLVAALSIAGVVGACFAANEWVATHRTLHVVNGFDTPLSVRLDDDAEFQAPPRRRVTIAVSEGEHLASVRARGMDFGGGKFRVESNLQRRFLGRQLFVLNPGGGATLVEEKVIYAALRAPGQAPAQPPARFHLGDFFLAFKDIDYPFEEFPRSVKVPSGGAATKWRVSMAPQNAAQIVAAGDDIASVEDRMQLAEAHLRLAPNNVALREAYRRAGDQAGQPQRVARFLAGLAK